MMEEIYANVEWEKPVGGGPSIHENGPFSAAGPRSSQKNRGAVIWFLGLLSLLLAGIIGLGIHCHISARDSYSEFSTIVANLTERLSSLTEQRDLLNVSLSEVTKELQTLKKTCPSGWRMFGRSCYLFSTHKTSWEMSRKDCRDRGADLVIINSQEEQKFLTNATEEAAWIGLSDRDEEGTWNWVDDTPLTLMFWPEGQPDNGANPRIEEDCIHLRAGRTKVENWNDGECSWFLHWICEKKLNSELK